MPIFHVELSGEPPPALARRLADELGALMDSAPGHTWVRIVPCDAAHYAENEIEGAPRSVFVRVILRALPEEDALAERARAITRVVAAASERAEEDVHVYFDPPAAGRIAFGGELVRIR
jgi:phenylpyruvate tautomerase PptA (4-oxalocrotonate tautomerase family)